MLLIWKLIELKVILFNIRVITLMHFSINVFWFIIIRLLKLLIVIIIRLIKGVKLRIDIIVAPVVIIIILVDVEHPFNNIDSGLAIITFVIGPFQNVIRNDFGWHISILQDKTLMRSICWIGVVKLNDSLVSEPLSSVNFPCQLIVSITEMLVINRAYALVLLQIQVGDAW